MVIRTDFYSWYLECVPGMAYRIQLSNLRGGGVIRSHSLALGRRGGAIRMFDIACLTEHSGDKLRLHTVCHGSTVTEIVSWYDVRAVSRACKSRHYTRRFKVFDHDELLLSNGALTHMLTPLLLPAIEYLFPGDPPHYFTFWIYSKFPWM